jgi:acyl-CoA thioesterase-1
VVQGQYKKLLLVIWLFLTATSIQASQAIKSIMVFGDSLSAAYGIDYDAGWVTLLEQRLDKKGYDIEVINASISGNTSGNGLNRIEKDLEKHDPDLLILELGGNDGLRGHPPKRLKENLRSMIEISRARGTEVLLVGMQLPPSYGKRYTTAFAKVYPELAEEMNVPLVESFIDTVGVDLELMQNDRIHPNEKGQPLLLDNVWPQLKALLDQS